MGHQRVSRLFAWCFALSFCVLASGESAQGTLEGLHLVARDNCGVAGEQPHLVSSEGDYRYPERDVPPEQVPSDHPARTVAYGARVRYRLHGLRRDATYTLDLTYLSDSDQRTQSLLVDGSKVQGRFRLPKAEVVHQVIDLAHETYQDGGVDLEFVRHSGPNAVVSAIELWSDHDALLRCLTLEAHGDCAGRILGSVRDANTHKAVAEAEVRAALPGAAAPVVTQTDDAGAFVLRIAEPDRPSANEAAEVVARSGEATATARVALAEVFAPAPRLTPLPSRAGSVLVKPVDLSGTWRFHPDPPDGFWSSDFPTSEGWSDIEVPGEWAMQGFDVAEGVAAAYVGRFRVHSDWFRHRIKLRCDAVYSDATVWVNGEEVGRHLGGFTPFEVDITNAIACGRDNVLAMAVKNGSVADTLASGTRYAAHPLGGITRKLYVFPVPSVHVASLHVATPFDDDYENATLQVALRIANQSDHLPSRSASVTTLDKMRTQHDVAARFHLTAPDGDRVWLSPKTMALGKLDNAQTVDHVFAHPVLSPTKWDAEHPRLYELTCELLVDGHAAENVARRFGFRQVEVRGNEVLVNGRPVKLRGVCRHEVHPLRGRSLTPELWRRDAELFRDANVNYIRTSHYPPAEEFLEACDELGLFVEAEAPFCWAKPGSPADHALVMQSTLEMVERDRSHPCVLMWSLANESTWGPAFEASARAVKLADPTRPLKFTYGIRRGDVDQAFCEIGGYHYPGPGGPEKFADYPRPVVFDEYCHLNVYNRREVVTDPGLRDAWGRGFAAMWEKMQASPGCLGGAIWSGIDEVFCLPSGEQVGYGAWGPIDGWRRPKPEYAHIKKAYSPVRVVSKALEAPAAGRPLTVEVANRHDFTDLNELRIEWALGDARGEVQAAAPPRSTGVVALPEAATASDGQDLLLRFFSPRGFLIDACRIPLGAAASTESVEPPDRPESLTVTDDTIAIRGDLFACEVNPRTGLIRRAEAAGAPVLIGGPYLMLLPLAGGKCATTHRADTPPLNDLCRDWEAQSVKARRNEDRVEVRVKGRYEEASGSYTMTFDGAGGLSVDYRFVCRKDVDPRQVGVVFDLPAAFDTLAWEREAQWTAYPEDHIGRPKGVATALAAPSRNWDGRTEPTWPWALDAHALGTNDFRSTKHHVRTASLTAADGSGLVVRSDGRHTVRAFVDGGRVRFLLAVYSNGGGEPFFSRHLVEERRPLKAGDVIEDMVRLELAGPCKDTAE